MDKERARFLLSSFRPDGADAKSIEFAKALELAAEDRELGEWLARERAMDAAFADALVSVEIPTGLRDEILAVLENDLSSVAAGDDDLDALFAGGMMGVEPPEGLSESIVSAMELQTMTEEVENVVDAGLWRWMTTAAVAAVVAVGLFVASTIPESADDDLLVNGQVDEGLMHANGVVRQVAVRSAVEEMGWKLRTPARLAVHTHFENTNEALEYLADQGHPVPAVLPAGLEGGRFIGARDIELRNGLSASLLCFELDGLGVVHLLVFDIDAIKDAEKLTSMKSVTLSDCYDCDSAHFNVAHWSDGSKAYMLLTRAKKEDLVELF